MSRVESSEVECSEVECSEVECSDVECSEVESIGDLQSDINKNLSMLIRNCLLCLRKHRFAFISFFLLSSAEINMPYKLFFLVTFFPMC